MVTRPPYPYPYRDPYPYPYPEPKAAGSRARGEAARGRCDALREQIAQLLEDKVRAIGEGLRLGLGLGG